MFKDLTDVLNIRRRLGSPLMRFKPSYGAVCSCSEPGTLPLLLMVLAQLGAQMLQNVRL
jgi:hypothetical protein